VQTEKQRFPASYSFLVLSKSVWIKNQDSNGLKSQTTHQRKSFSLSFWQEHFNKTHKATALAVRTLPDHLIGFLWTKKYYNIVTECLVFLYCGENSHVLHKIVVIYLFTHLFIISCIKLMHLSILLFMIVNPFTHGLDLTILHLVQFWRIQLLLSLYMYIYK